MVALKLGRPNGKKSQRGFKSPTRTQTIKRGSSWDSKINPSIPQKATQPIADCCQKGQSHPALSQQHVLGTSLLLASCMSGQLDPWSNLDEKQPGWQGGGKKKKVLLSWTSIFLIKHLAWLQKYWGMCKTGERNTHLGDSVDSGMDTSKGYAWVWEVICSEGIALFNSAWATT